MKTSAKICLHECDDMWQHSTRVCGSMQVPILSQTLKSLHALTLVHTFSLTFLVVSSTWLLHPMGPFKIGIVLSLSDAFSYKMTRLDWSDWRVVYGLTIHEWQNMKSTCDLNTTSMPSQCQKLTLKFESPRRWNSAGKSVTIDDGNLWALCWPPSPSSSTPPTQFYMYIAINPF